MKPRQMIMSSAFVWLNCKAHMPWTSSDTICWTTWWSLMLKSPPMITRPCPPYIAKALRRTACLVGSLRLQENCRRACPCIPHPTLLDEGEWILTNTTGPPSAAAPGANAPALNWHTTAWEKRHHRSCPTRGSSSKSLATWLVGLCSTFS